MNEAVDGNYTDVPDSDASSREVVPYKDDAASAVVVGGSNGSPTFYALPSDRETNWAELTKATPATRILIHPKGFRYVSIEYVLFKLNKVFGPNGWDFKVTHAAWATDEDRGPGKDLEFIVQGYLVAPGMPPRFGIGGHLYNSRSGMGFAAVRASAETEALKNASRKIGIGADVHGGEAANDAVAGQQNTIKSLYGELVKMEKGDAAKKAVLKIAPGSFNGDALVHTAIGEDEVSRVISALQEVLVGK